MKTSSSEKHFLYVLMAIVFALTVAIFWPFLTVIILAVAFAVVLTPVFKWINKYLTKRISWLASLITVILFFLVLCIPVFFVGKVVLNQVQDIYKHIVVSGDSNSIIQSIDTSINRIMPEGFNFDTYGKIAQLTGNLTSKVAGLFASTFRTIVLFVLMILTIFYLLKDGENWKKNVVMLCPISEKHTNEILETMRKAINRIFKGSFLIAIVQGVLMSIGLKIFGVPNAAIWGVVAGMASFIPTLGTSVVSVPAIIYLFLSGMQLQALGLLIWAVLAVGMIDNVLSPYVISKDTEISSLFILLAILGGVSLLGPVGIFIGPLVLSLLYSLVSIYKKDIAHQS